MPKKKLLTDEVKLVHKISGSTLNRRVNGIESMFPEEGDKTHCFVDKSIAGIIARLAERKQEPWTSCSGLIIDHYDLPRPHFRAYLGIKIPGFGVRAAAVSAGFHVEESHFGGIILRAWPERNFVPVVPDNAEAVLTNMWQSFAVLIGAEFPT